MSFGYEETPHYSPHGTVLARHIASAVDNTLMIVLIVVLAKQVDEQNIPLQALVVVATYLGYFFASEALTSRTVGKLLTGLKVVDFDGERCTLSQIGIRTLFRLLEVNPLLLGAIPAAASIIFSRHKQRFGDKFARTVVVFSRR